MKEHGEVHVLHVVPTLGAGGLELAMCRVVNALTGMRHSICCLKGEAIIRDRFDPSVDIHCMRAKRNEPMLAFRLRALITQVCPSAIHARNWGAWPDVALSRLVARQRVPLIFSFHGLDGAARMPLRRRVASRMLACTTAHIFTVSGESKRFLAEDIGLPARRIGVIANGVDIDRFSPVGPRAAGRTLVIGTVGSLTPVKNHALLIRAFAELVARNAVGNLQLRLAGGGPLRDKLSGLVDTLGIGGRVDFAGQIVDVAGFLQRLDIFVLPSDSEAMPNALIEAMACGLPCVATRVGGVPEILDFGRVGRLVEAGDCGSLVYALHELCQEPALRRQLGQAARQRVCENYSMRRMISEYEALYRSASEGSSSFDRPAKGGECGPGRAGVLMLGPLPPPTGGMASVVENLRTSNLVNRSRLTVMGNGKSTEEGRRLWKGVAAQVGLMLQISRVVCRDRARLIHIHTCSGFTFWRDSLHVVVARILGCKGVWHVHGARFDQFAASLGGVRRRLLRWLLESSAAVIVLGDAWIEKLRPFAPRANWRVIPNGVPVPPRKNKSGLSKPLFLFLGNLEDRKGAGDLIAAVATASKDGFNGLVQIAGRETEDGQADKLRAQMAACGCADRVELLGTVVGPAKEEALGRADCFVLPSYAEGLPMAMLEAMAHGVPVIVTRVGAIPEAITDGVEGFLIEPGDTDALADRMLRVVGDRELRARMGQAARRRVQEQYSLDAMVDRLMEVYREVLKP